MKYNTLIISALDIGYPVSYVKNINIPKPNIYVTFFYLPSIGKFYADDEEKAREYNIQVDIWCKAPNSYQPIMDSIIEKLAAVGFSFSDGPEFYEDETDIVHKVLEFKIVDEERMNE